MSIQIALFNHKGGVSKTTTCFNLGWMLAEKGQSVLLVDCDPQCNLTGMTLGFKGEDELRSVYEAEGIRNIRDGLAPAFESRPELLKPVICEEVIGRPNMHLLPGHIGLAEYEVTLGIAQELSGSLVTLQNLPGSLRHLFNITAESIGANIVIIDMSPSLGSLNQNLLMTSDYFIVPMAPDYYSVMATDSLSSVLPRWKNWADKAKINPLLKEASYPFPETNPKFLGTVIQKYRIRQQGRPSAAFQKWIDEINEGVKSKLLPLLETINMALDADKYRECGIEPGDPILQMSDFNSLIALSQKHQAPVFSLTDDQLEQTGIVLERTKASMNNFRESFDQAAGKILCLLSNESD